MKEIAPGASPLYTERMFGSRVARRAPASPWLKRHGLTTFAALWPELRERLQGVTMASNDAARFEEGTVRELVRLLEQRIETVERVGCCPECHEAELRRFVVQLRRLAEEAAGSPGKAA